VLCLDGLNVGAFESAFLHPSDHHELWSLWNWQSGSREATVALVDGLRGDKTDIIATFLHLQQQDAGLIQ